ncbi:YARHG domain-containing protein [Lacrimispora sp.]|uniref:YARHG domain-containing protein n=1 Tax=Lacrimispora sp. TaxID=2719234 RepID=UPI0034603BCC
MKNNTTTFFIAILCLLSILLAACGKAPETIVSDQVKESQARLNSDEENLQIESNDNSITSSENSKEINETEGVTIKTEEVQNKYWIEVVNWDEENLRTDASRMFEPLLNSDSHYYKRSNLESFPKVILYLAKNEIYARHGYIFMNDELSNYFKKQTWYSPTIKASEFSDDVFNEYEVANLQLLVDMLSELE